MNWVEERINTIFTKVCDDVSVLETYYPDLNFTMDDDENLEPSFPTVYMFFDFVERGTTLDGGVINAVYMTVRTRVSVTMEQGNNVARDVNNAVRESLARLFFITSGSPIPTKSGDIKVINANYHRVIGFNDPI